MKTFCKMCDLLLKLPTNIALNHVEYWIGMKQTKMYVCTLCGIC